jgi:hypothetical protein
MREAGVRGVDAIVTLAGCVVVLAVSVVTGADVRARAAATHSSRPPRDVGRVARRYLLHVHVAARVDGGLSALLTVGELRALYLTYAIALVAGMRLAFSRGAIPRRW